MSLKLKLLLIPLVLVVGAAAYAATRSDSAPVDPKTVHVVAKRDLKVEVTDIGKIQPRERIEIKSKIPGQVLEVKVREGDRVKAGQVLLVLEPTDYARDVARAEADVARVQNALELAEINRRRQRRGFEQRVVPEFDYQIAEHEHRAKMVELRLAEIALEAAKDRLAYTQVTAPIDGTVLELGIKPGEVVTPGIQQTFEGRPLLTIGDLGTLVVRAELNQIDAAKVTLGQAVTLSFDALAGKTYSARVTKTAPAAVTVKGKDYEVFPIEATLEAPGPEIRPGMTADVRIEVAVHPAVLAVPIEVVKKEDGKSYVLRRVKGSKEKKSDKLEVELGARSDREVELTAGVAEGDELLIDPSSAKDNEVDI